jgi:hypothetical protein
MKDRQGPRLRERAGGDQRKERAWSCRFDNAIDRLRRALRNDIVTTLNPSVLNGKAREYVVKTISCFSTTILRTTTLEAVKP